MSPWLYDPEHWWNRAEEARNVASEMSNDQAIHLMNQVVQAYERLARIAENLQTPRPEPQQPSMTLKTLSTWKRRV